MAVVENRFVCDLSKPVQAQALKGNVFSLDNLGSRLSVLIYDNGQPATISGSVTANCILPDGSTVNVNGSLTTENGGSKAYVDVPQSCLLIPGTLKIAIKCTSSSVITTLAAIVANVYMTKTDNVITPSQQIINDWNAEISAAIATQNAAIANQDTKINDLKSALCTYETGDYTAVQLTIPAGTTGNLNPIIEFPDYSDGMDCYIDYDSSVYDGTVRILSVDYTAECIVDKSKGNVYKGLKKVYIRIYYDYMVKSGGTVVGGTITFYYRPSNSIGDKANMMNYYIANGGNGVTWTKNEPVMLTLTDDNHFLMINGATKTVTKSQILTAATNAGLTVSGNTIKYITYTIYYDTYDDSVKAISGTNSKTLTHYPILFAAHYSSYVKGLIVDFINNKKLTEEINKTKDPTAEIAKSVSDPNYLYVDFTIPANQTERLDLSFVLPNNDYMGGISVYYEATGVYSGVVRIFPSNWTSECLLDNAGLKNKFNFAPRWIRFYTDHMEKDGQGNVIGGTFRLYYKYCPSLASPIVNDEALEDIIGKSVPSYFKSNIETAYETIRSNMMEVGRDGETFVFITDLHWEGNARNSPSLVRYLLDRLNINTILCGGDLINQGTRDSMVNAMLGCIVAFQHKNILFPCAFGNHDDNWNNYGGQREHPERKFDAKTQYALMQKQAEGIVHYFTSTGWNFYIDVPNTKTRFIVLDTGEDGVFSSYSDLINVLNDTPNGYHITIMAHWLYDYGISTSCMNIQTIIDAYNARESGTIAETQYDFTNASSEIFLLLGGHLHDDMDWTTDDGVPVVLTDTDSNRTSNTDYPYIKGTITEQAFDVITINYTTKTVKAVRVGRGADRTFSRT